MDELTDRQLDILRFIAEISQERGFPPTIREIGSRFGIRSTNGVNDHLKALERKGFLNRGEQQSRALVPTKAARLRLGLGGSPQGGAVDIPVIGRVAAGAPLLAEELSDDRVQIDASFLPQSGKDIFALRVQGSSMIGDGIFDGDIVFVHRQPVANHGEIAVAMIDGEATVKRYYPEGDRIRLQPSNPELAPIYIEKSAARQSAILGVVVGVFRKISGRA